MKRKPTRDGLGIIHRHFYQGRPERIADLELARATAAMARCAYDLREAAGSSRRELARFAKTSASAIRRFEEDDFDRHSLDLIQRIARALGQHVDIRLLPMRRRSKSA